MEMLFPAELQPQSVFRARIIGETRGPCHLGAWDLVVELTVCQAHCQRRPENSGVGGAECDSDQPGTLLE